MTVAASGLFSQFGIGKETTYGTYVAPTRFHHMTGFDLQPEYGRVQAESFKPGGLTAPGNQYVDTTFGATGQFSSEVMTNGWGLLLEQVFGSSTSAQEGATTAYTQVHTLASTQGKSLSLQGSRPISGSSVPVTVKGAKVTSLELSCSTDGLLTATVAFDGREIDNTTALATATYPSAARPWSGNQMCVKLGAFGSEAEVTGFKGVKLSISRSLDTTRHYACAAGKKSEPVANDWVSVSGSLSRDWLDKTTLEDLALANTPTNLKWVFTGPVIEGAHNYSLVVSVPSVYLSARSQGVEGKGTLSRDWEFEHKSDGTNPVTVTVVTTDTAL